MGMHTRSKKELQTVRDKTVPRPNFVHQEENIHFSIINKASKL